VEDYDPEGLRLAALRRGDGSLWQTSKSDTDSHNIHRVLGSRGCGLARGQGCFVLFLFFVVLGFLTNAVSLRKTQFIFYIALSHPLIITFI